MGLKHFLENTSLNIVHILRKYRVFWFDAGKVVKCVLTCIIVMLWNPDDPYLQKVQELAASTVNSRAKWI